MSDRFREVIATGEQFDELRALCGGNPSQRASDKVITTLDSHCREFIAKSPFLSMSTSNASGRCDVSPRGDEPGFVLVLDDHHLFIPERPGNRRMDSVQNILTNPHIGLQFYIPGLGETLRVNGKAFICRDLELLERCVVNGRAPVFGIGVEVEECYSHCAKAFIRSGLWSPDSWLHKDQLPSPSQMLIDHAKLQNVTAEEVAIDMNEGYKQRLY
ncbi:pyridoxamine 5'-phosphate oxidase family protein [Paenibacillus sp. MMS18-CY102]|uniref:pyridoxamine 5'-phosphate oxidase family protein n=1 Tax=Paenibacillus sp. MMS18-CY102 TaxID=2682849 RepID=UPI00136577FC|nr:pyridoxamine 5'-phosphate oxidase family protein [Paenibacillus sp. MMS18-CY102]MWC28137.1 pyridoxamine 5'-phosphate oxidase family protein [Paenibacillus sp. MMS18-CY102]